MLSTRYYPVHKTEFYVFRRMTLVEKHFVKTTSSEDNYFLLSIFPYCRENSSNVFHTLENALSSGHSNEYELLVSKFLKKAVGKKLTTLERNVTATCGFHHSIEDTIGHKPICMRDVFPKYLFRLIFVDDIR